MEVNEKIQRIRYYLTEGKPLDGKKIANEIGTTRSYVSKVIKKIRETGIEINSIVGVGYKISDKYDLLNKYSIDDRLTTKTLGRNLLIFDEIKSTNDYAKEMAHENFINGTVVIADSQTAGKGRMGRSFISPKNVGVYFTILLKPQTSLEISELFTSAAAVAVATALDKLYNIDTKIKWVNDIYYNSKKICGILTEASINFETVTLDYAVIGIGINVYDARKYFPDTLSKASSLEVETGKRISRNTIVAEVLNELEEILNNIDKREFLKIYKEKSNVIGKEVVVKKAGNEKHAKAIDIGENAELIVDFGDGVPVKINSGEARVVPDDYA